MSRPYWRGSGGSPGRTGRRVVGRGCGSRLGCVLSPGTAGPSGASRGEGGGEITSGFPGVLLDGFFAIGMSFQDV